MQVPHSWWTICMWNSAFISSKSCRLQEARWVQFWSQNKYWWKLPYSLETGQPQRFTDLLMRPVKTTTGYAPWRRTDANLYKEKLLVISNNMILSRCYTVHLSKGSTFKIWTQALALHTPERLSARRSLKSCCSHWWAQTNHQQHLIIAWHDTGSTDQP